MNGMSVEVPVQQPELDLSSEANNHLVAAGKTVDRRSSGFGVKKSGFVRRIFGSKLLIPATAALLLAAGCSNIGNREPTFTEAPSSTPVVSEQQTPTLTPELSPRETVVQLRKEIQAESSKIMDNWEKDGQKIGYFFINIGGEKTPQGEDHRVFLLPIPIKDYFSVGPSDRNRYVLMTSEGLKTFSPRPNEFPTSFDEEFNRNFFNPYYEYFQRSLTQSIITAAESGTTPDNPFQLTLSKQIESPSPLYPPGVKYPLSLELSPHDLITYTDFEGKKTLPTTSLYIPPINDRVKEVTEESKKMTEDLTGRRIDREQRRLQDTKDLSNTLQSPSLPSPQPPTPTP